MDEHWTIRYYGDSDCGVRRTQNEDRFEILGSEARPEGKSDGAHLFVVADGMGGHLAGDVAADIVCEVFREKWAEERSCADADQAGALARWILEANQRICARGAADPACTRMGSTATALLVEGGRVWIGHVGDSRIYRMRRGEALVLLTEDHTEVAFMVSKGRITEEEARTHPRRSVLLRSLGESSLDAVDTQELSIAPGDRFLVCSDGVNEMLRDDEIGAILGEGAPPDATVARLIEAANTKGGWDNVTAVVIDMFAVAESRGADG